MRWADHHPCQWAVHAEDQLAKSDLDSQEVAHDEVDYEDLQNMARAEGTANSHSHSLPGAESVLAFAQFLANGRVVDILNSQNHLVDNYCLVTC